jgi:hypothetical protein
MPAYLREYSYPFFFSGKDRYFFLLINRVLNKTFLFSIVRRLEAGGGKILAPQK